MNPKSATFLREEMKQLKDFSVWLYDYYNNVYLQKYIISFSFIFFYLCQDTTISVPPKEPDNTKHKHGSNDIGRKVIISTGSIITLVLMILLLQNLYKKLHILSTRNAVISDPDDVYETINPAVIHHRLQAMIDRMCLCCPSNPNNEQYVWHYLSTMIFSILFFDELCFSYLLFDK